MNANITLNLTPKTAAQLNLNDAIDALADTGDLELLSDIDTPGDGGASLCRRCPTETPATDAIETDDDYGRFWHLLCETHAKALLDRLDKNWERRDAARKALATAQEALAKA